eukprot:TRINITY_DN21993_c0_g1_i1.p1 TRINITY_DN21993_c0_g1~~TRINITY_DN21993_c0_g1_i1.p1  ORF type:complete len:708 (+),score=253.90 TRINITY_DN21993_c0_g1_i1:57-2126(+)
MEGEDDSGYEAALAQNTELRLQLQTAVADLGRKEEDNAMVRQMHDSLQHLYKRLQEERDALQKRLRQEQVERDEAVKELQGKLAHSREQLKVKCSECEDLQQRYMSPEDVNRLRRKFEDDIREEEFEPHKRLLEGRIAEEQRRALNLQRQLEQERSKMKLAEAELQDKLAAQDLVLHGKQQACDASKLSLEAEKKRVADLEAQASRLRCQLSDQETKAKGLQTQLQERELQSEREQSQLAEQLRLKVDEASDASRKAFQLQRQLEEEGRRQQKLIADAEALRLEQVKLQQQLDQAEAKVQFMGAEVPEEVKRLREELSQQRSSHLAERDQHSNKLKALEEKLQAAEAASKRLEEKLDSLQERDDAHDQAEQKLAAENSSLRAQMEFSEKESESRRQSWREREVMLVKQVEEAASRVESLSDELVQCQVAQEDMERRLHETKQGQQQREASLQAHANQVDSELLAMKEKVERLEKERQEQASASEALRAKLRKEEQCCQLAQAEVSAVNSRLDSERAAWARQSDEAQTAALAAEEQRRSATLQKLSEDHKRQMGKLSAAAKKALQKAKLKRQELKNKCQDLAKRALQLQSEKATAIRVCQENKNAYELRLAELGMAFSGGPHLGYPPENMLLPSPSTTRASEAALAGGTAHRRELREISERLEEHAAWLQSHSRGAKPPPSPPASTTSPP